MEKGAFYMDITEMEYKVLYLKEKVEERHKYEQLAEECCELAQASLKYIRTLDSSNPTPVSKEEAYACVKEEIVDVLLCLDVLDADFEDFMDPLYESKLNRWFDRIIRKVNVDE